MSIHKRGDRAYWHTHCSVCGEKIAIQCSAAAYCTDCLKERRKMKPLPFVKHDERGGGD